MASLPFSFPIFKAFESTGTFGPLAGGKLYTFQAGTSTPLAVYQDEARTVPHANPVILDAYGQATIYLGTAPYKMRLDSSADVTQPGWPVDDIVDYRAYTDTLRSDLSASSGSSIVGFIQAGAGAVDRTVQDKNREWVSVKDFGAVGDGIADDGPAIQKAINTGASTLIYPDGVYNIATPVSVSSFQTHKCSSGGATLTSSGIIFTHTTVQQFITLDGLRFSGSGKVFYQPNTNIYTVNLEIKNCFFSRTLEECVFATLLLAHIHDNHFGSANGTAHASHRHLRLVADPTGTTAINLNTFKNNRFNDAGASSPSAIYIEYGSDNTFEGNDFESNNSTVAIRINGGGVSNFYNNWFESNEGAHQIYFENTAAIIYSIYYNRVINFKGNNVVLLKASNTHVFYLDANSYGLNADGNKFFTNRVAGAKITDTPAGNNAGVTMWLPSNSSFGSTYTIDTTGIFTAANLSASNSMSVGGSSALTATALFKGVGSATPFRVVSAADANLFYVGNTGQFNSGTAADSPYNSTTASAANLVVLSNGVFQRSTSAAKYKRDIRSLESLDINKLRAVRYKSACESDDQTVDHFGLIADEVLEAGLIELVTFGQDGGVEGLQYERLTAVLLRAIQDLRSDFDTYKESHP